MDWQMIFLELAVKVSVVVLTYSYNSKLGSAVGLYFGWEVARDLYLAYRNAKITGAVIKAVQEIQENRNNDEDLH